MTGVQKAIKIGAICLAGFIIICIFNFILFTVASISGFNTKTTSYNETFKDIKNIDVDVTGLNIIIEKGEELRVDAVDVNEHLKMSKNGNTLKIKESNYWLFKMGKSGSIKITVPEGILNKLEIEAGAGTINISEIVAESLKLDQGAGTIEISESAFNQADVDGGAGEIKVNNSVLNNLDLDCGVGKVYIDGLIHGKSKIDCGVGELSLNIQELKDNYKIIASKGIGSILIDSVSYKDDVTLGEGSNVIKIDGGVGAIDISFKELN